MKYIKTSLLINGLCQKHDLTQEKFAKMIGVSRETLAHVFAGTGCISPAIAARIMREFGESTAGKLISAYEEDKSSVYAERLNAEWNTLKKKKKSRK